MHTRESATVEVARAALRAEVSAQLIASVRVCKANITSNVQLMSLPADHTCMLDTGSVGSHHGSGGSGTSAAIRRGRVVAVQPHQDLGAVVAHLFVSQKLLSLIIHRAWA